MVIVPLPFFYPYYIKKEDAKDILRRQRKMVAFLLFLGLVLIGIMQFFAAPKLLKLYKDLNEPVHLITQLSPYIIGAIVAVFSIISVYFLATPPNYERLDRVLNKYKEGEMIKTTEIIEIKYVILILILLGLVIGFIVLSSVVPIYNLTGKFQ